LPLLPRRGRQFHESHWEGPWESVPTVLRFGADDAIFGLCKGVGKSGIDAEMLEQAGFGSSIPTKWRASYDQGIGDKSRGRKMARLGSQAGDFLNE
jgi:hypothetical protein